VTVAASSFDMTITDPSVLLDDIDVDRLQEILGTEWEVKSPLEYVEPPAKEKESPTRGFSVDESQGEELHVRSSSPSGALPSVAKSEPTAPTTITGRAQNLGDFIDTDALAPAEALIGNLSPEDIGKYCLYHTHPDFRRRVKEGANIVVAGRAFGVGSSRENAVTALMGAGVQCVIARSFAFIYARNQPNLGLLGIVMEDEEFYKLAVDEADIQILVDERIIKVGEREFGFTLSDLEIRLWEQGGMSAAFARWGKKMLENVTAQSSPSTTRSTLQKKTEHEELKW
jgi:3-isopropylmalate dehydratase small subunit